MSDLGFGIVDRRSVLVVLFTLGLSKLLLGYNIPIDTSNLLTAFIGLLVLTGFIYAARSIFRLVLTMLVFVLRIPYDLVAGLIKRDKKLRGLRGFIIIFLNSIRDSFLLGFFYPSFFMKEWAFDKYFSKYDDRFTNIQLGALGALDRIFLIGIAFSSTVPSLANYLRIIGFGGIFIMLFVYVVTGTFSFILDDAILRGELQQEEMLSATRSASHPYIGTITTRQEIRDTYGGGL